MENLKILMMGEILRDPEPYLLPNRNIGCRLTVHSYRLSFVGKKQCRRGGIYSVDISDSSCWLFLKYAGPGDRILVSGILSGTHIQESRIITGHR